MSLADPVTLLGQARALIDEAIAGLTPVLPVPASGAMYLRAGVGRMGVSFMPRSAMVFQRAGRGIAGR